MSGRDSSDFTDFVRSKGVFLGTYCPPCENNGGSQQGETGPTGADGARGSTGGTGGTGVTGATGFDGMNGNTILNGIIPPTNLVGDVGDFYLDTTTSMLYGPKSPVYSYTGLGGALYYSIFTDSYGLSKLSSNPSFIANKQVVTLYIYFAGTGSTNIVFGATQTTSGSPTLTVTNKSNNATANITFGSSYMLTYGITYVLVYTCVAGRSLQQISFSDNTGGSATDTLTLVSVNQWSLSTSLKGATGVDGMSGATGAGTQGATGATGAGVPSGINFGDYIYWNGTSSWVAGGANILIGSNAGKIGQGSLSVAVGAQAGSSNQQINCVAIGGYAGSLSQGYSPDGTNFLGKSVAVGYEAGYQNQQGDSVAIGYRSGYTGQSFRCVAIGVQAGQTNQSAGCLAIGFEAGLTTQGQGAFAIGGGAGRTNQGVNAFALGTAAGYNNQGALTLAIGTNAGRDDQKSNATAIGNAAGKTSQGIGALAIGGNAGEERQGDGTIAIGDHAGFTDQKSVATAIGGYAGSNTQGQGAVAFGSSAGRYVQGEFAVAIGNYASWFSQGSNSVSIGTRTAFSNQGSNCVAIGAWAGYYIQGNNAIAIGFGAGFNGIPNPNFPSAGTPQISNSIVLNATGTVTNSDASGFYVNPVRGLASTTYTLQYNPTTNEISYTPPASDMRLKTNVSDTALGLDFIRRLRPVQFQWRDRKSYSLESPEGQPLSIESEGVRVHQGLIAQEVKSVLEDLSLDSAIYVRISDIPTETRAINIDPSKNITLHDISLGNGMNGLHGVRYEELITPTIKAVQDVYAIVKQQSEQIALLQFRIQTLETMISSSQSRV